MSVEQFFDFDWCKDAFTYWPGHTDTTHSGLFTFVVGCLQFLGLLFILGYLWRQNQMEKVIRKDDKDPTQSLDDPSIAANTLIFPLYVRILWLCAFSALWCGLVTVFLPFNYDTPNTLFLSIMYSIAWAVQHLLFEGIALLLMSYGVGSRATHVAMFGASLWALTTFGAEFFMYYKPGSSIAIWINTTWATALCLFYLILWLSPPHWIYRRPALHSYAAFFAVTRAMTIASNIMRFFHYDFGYCMYGLSSTGILSAVIPYIIFAALLRDSRYWQGILTLKSDGLEESGYLSIRNPLLGTSLDPSSARAIAQRMDHRQHGVPILNFANLKIDQLANEYTSNRDRHVVLGAGSTSRVFRGTWQDKPVAIKMIFCVDLTPEIISKFYHEATLLADLVHPNVVSIIGVCVLPPAICLVMELCPGGNLYDYLRAHPNAPLSDQLRIACDCSRAVSYLHSHTPAILHLDLKSMNFLLASDGSIKVADLELSREVVVNDSEEEMSGASGISEEAQTVVQHVATGSALSGYHIPDTVNWIAPEIMLGLPYNEKADVYSLAMVVWEILTGEVPFYDLQQQIAKQPKSAPSSTRSTTRRLSPSLSPYDMPRPSPHTAITAASVTGFNRYASQTISHSISPSITTHGEARATSPTVSVQVVNQDASPPMSSLSSMCSSRSSSSSVTTSPDVISQSYHSPPQLESSISAALRQSASEGSLPVTPSHVVTSMTSASFLYNTGMSPSPSIMSTTTTTAVTTPIPPIMTAPTTTLHEESQPSSQLTSPQVLSPRDTSSTSAPHLTIHVTSEGPMVSSSRSVYVTPYESPATITHDDSVWGRTTRGTLTIPQRPRAATISDITSTIPRASFHRPETREELIRRLQALQSPPQAPITTTITPASIRDRIPRMARFSMSPPKNAPIHTVVGTSSPSRRSKRNKHSKSKSTITSRSHGIASHAAPRLHVVARSRDEINDELKRMICEQGVRPLIPPTCPPALASLLQRAWATDPDQRPSAAEFCQSLLVIRLELINQENALDHVLREQPSLPASKYPSPRLPTSHSTPAHHGTQEWEQKYTSPQHRPITIVSTPSSTVRSS